MRVRVTVRPGCRVEAIEERPDGPLLVKVRAPAREGRANAAVIAAVARHFGVPKSSVRIVAGRGGREKLLELPAASRATPSTRPAAGNRSAGSGSRS